MSGHHDRTGPSWAALLAVRYINHGKNGARRVFRCVCGREKTMPLRFVRNGKRTTCGACGPAKRGTTPAIAWPFPRVLGTDSQPISPVWRAHESVTI